MGVVARARESTVAPDIDDAPDPTPRQISPQIAATLLTTPRPDLTAGVGA